MKGKRPAVCLSAAAFGDKNASGFSALLVDPINRIFEVTPDTVTLEEFAIVTVPKRTTFSNVKFLKMDTYVWQRFRRIKVRQHKRNLRPDVANTWTRDFFYKLGLYRLRGTVRYPQPSKVYQESLPVSRVRENRTHGLKGSFTEIPAMKGM